MMLNVGKSMQINGLGKATPSYETTKHQLAGKVSHNWFSPGGPRDTVATM